MSLSRRDFFSRILPKIKQEPPRAPGSWPDSQVPPAPSRPPAEEPAPSDIVQPVIPPGTDTFAVISGRYCLAYQGTPCSMCSEQCPESGAIVIEDGLPRVVIDLCTGCQVCHQVCPAPNNAVRLVPRSKLA